MSDVLRRLADELGWTVSEPEPGFFVAKRGDASVFGKEAAVRHRMQVRTTEKREAMRRRTQMAFVVKLDKTGSQYGPFPTLADAQAHEARLTKRWKRAANNPEPSPFLAATV